MKTTQIILAIGLSFIGGLHAEIKLPDEVIVKTEPTASKEFKEWVEEDPTKYGGDYAGDVGGDSSGSLEIKVTKGKPDAYPPFSATGTFSVRAAGAEATTVTFKNAACDPGDGGFVNATAFRVFFVLLDGKKGVVVNNIFLPRK